jgi:probable FeS assembly SUF system protein SufT
MQNEQPIVVKRDCEARMIPSGEKIILTSGSTVWMTQALGGSYNVMTDRGYMVRIEGKDRDAIGIAPAGGWKPSVSSVAKNPKDMEEEVWEQLRSCFDPEIPVNIVELGLIYHCSVEPLEGGGYRALVRFTLTAQGCGMGEVLKEDIEGKLQTLPGVRQVDVQLVWEPPWNQERMSPSARQQLGIE